MDVGSLFVTDAEPAEFEQPAENRFHDAAMNTQSTAMLRASFGDERLNAALAQRHADFLLRVVGAIGQRRVGTFAPPSPRSFDRWDRVDQGDGRLRIVDVRARVRDGQRRSLTIADNMPLRAIFAAIRGIGSSVRPPKTARTEQLSSAAFDQSISSARPSSSSSTRQSFSHRPIACQSRNRRQHVMPDPHPSSCGKYSHGQPVRSTNKTPVSACRFDTRGRPPLGLGGSGGNKGSTIVHNPSGSSGLAMRRSSMNDDRLLKATTNCQYRFC
jgi:hypothetical protein